MSVKPKCKICREPASIKVPAGHFCSIEHVYQHARKLQDKARGAKEKRARQEHRQRKEAVKTRSEWLKQAQTVFNQYIRLRDAGQPCISCQRHHQGQYHAGHYLSVGANPALRFTEENTHSQCMPCNAHLSGNIVNYRPNLINKIGQDRVDWLEGPHEPLKLSINEIKELIATYRAKIKELKSDTIG